MQEYVCVCKYVGVCCVWQNHTDERTNSYLQKLKKYQYKHVTYEHRGKY